MVSKSLATCTIPVTIVAWIFSTSFVTRVIKRPMGFRSRYCSDMRCRWSKISIRISYMVFWPTMATMIICI